MKYIIHTHTCISMFCDLCAESKLMFNRVSKSVMCWDSEEPWWSSFEKNSPHITLMVCCEGPMTLNSTTSTHSLDYPTEKNPTNIPGRSPDNKAGLLIFSVAFLKHKLSAPITF